MNESMETSQNVPPPPPQQQEEEKNPFRSEGDLDKLLSQHDPNRMKLTKEEYENALSIKELIESMPDVDNLSDLMYAQYAIVCQNNMDDIINRCYGLQAFREEYQVFDSYQHGCKMLDWLIGLCPRQFMCFALDGEPDGTGSYMLVQDMEKFDPTIFTSPGLEEKYIAAMYYIELCFNPDFDAIRKGYIAVAECKGMDMRKDVLKHFSKFLSDFIFFYPSNGQCHCFHTGTMLNVIVSMLRKFLPENKKDEFQVGFQYEGHLADVFLTPTVEAANQRILKSLKEVLKIRYENEKTFKLR